MRFIQGILSTLLPLLLVDVARGQDWPGLGGNAARNGLTEVLGPTAPTLLWSNSDDFSIIAWQPVVDAQRVYTIRESAFPQNGGAAGDELVAYSLHSGDELWRTTLPWGGDTSTEWIAWIAGAANGRVYASRASHMQPGPIQAFDGASGTALWTSVATVETFAYDGVVFAPDGDLIVGDWQRILRLEASDGSLVWQTVRSCPVSGTCGPALGPDGVFIDEPAVGGNILTKLDPATGARLYSSPVMAGFTDQNTPFVSPDGATVYFSRSQNNASVDFLFAFDDTGAALVQRWSREIRWTTTHEHGIAADGSLYTFLPNDEFVRLDPVTGNVTASAGVLAPLGNPSPKTAVGVEGTVYVSNGWASTPATDGRLWAFSGDLSVTLFNLTLDRQNQGGPALAQSGSLVVCDRVGVRAYREDFSRYCSSTPNSTGLAALVAASGSNLAGGGNQLLLSAAPTQSGQPGIFFHGASQINVPFGNGSLCVGAPIVRLLPPVVADGSGTSMRVLDNGSFLPDQIRNFQYWYRDPMGGGANFNTSNAVSVRYR
jgi:hypothetical protein